MKVVSSYKAKMLHYNHIFDDTAAIYRKAVAFFLDVCKQEWADISALSGKKRNNYMEHLTIQTKKNPNPAYDFNTCSYKMPAYLRRTAIQEALGAYSSYVSNHENWVKNGKQGKEPKLTYNRNTMPTLYKGNMFLHTGSDTARVKVYHRKDWVWLDVRLCKQDVKYIEKHCLSDPNIEQKNPKLKKQGKCWYLTFPFEQNVTFADVSIKERLICAVDLGINQNAVCSIMQSDGTVAARKFINFATEKDHLYKALGRQKKAQQHGSRKTPVLWKHVNDINQDISRKTAGAIMDFVILYNVDVVVFEHLDTNGKKRGPRRQRLQLWRKREIQRIVEHQAHKCGIRASRICARGTSALAFDGSGKVERGKYMQNGKEKYNYSIGVFPNGKTYHCDLNASYNIGARYFIREMLRDAAILVRLQQSCALAGSRPICTNSNETASEQAPAVYLDCACTARCHHEKSESVMTGLPAEANGLRYGTGTTRTLSTLIRLNADLCATCA